MDQPSFDQLGAFARTIQDMTSLHVGHGGLVSVEARMIDDDFCATISCPGGVDVCYAYGPTGAMTIPPVVFE
jgi:hypothetical protein